MTWTLKDLRRRLGGTGFCGDTFISTATGGSGTTLVDTKIVANDGLYNFATIYFVNGPAGGDVRKVIDWASTTNTFTLDRAMTGTPAAGNEYEVHTTFNFVDKNAALNEAIREAALRWPRIIEDETLVTVANQFTYDISALTEPVNPLLGIDEVYEETTDTRVGAPWNQMDEGAWIVRVASVLTLQLMDTPKYPGQNLRLVYRARPSQLTTESSVLNPGVDELANYVTTRAAAILFERRSQIEGEDTTRGQWAVRAMDLNLKAAKLLTLDAPPKHLGSVVFSRWGGNKYGPPEDVVGRIRIP